MQVIPAIDLLHSKVVRLSQGDYSKAQTYSNNPSGVAREFVHSGMNRLHIVDLSGARENKPVHTNVIQEIKLQTRCKIQIGGGIRRLEHLEVLFDKCLDIASDHVILGSLPFEDEKVFKEIVSEYSSSIIIALDVWGETIKISGWQKELKKNIFDVIPEFQDKFGLDHFLITQIKKDGRMEGVDISLYKNLRERFPETKLIASGGVSSVEDIKKLNERVDLNALVVGRALYEKKISLKQIQELNKTMKNKVE